MNVTTDVIHDLLPLYLAGEASADSSALIEEYLRVHPDEAERLRGLAARSAALLAAPAPAPAPDLERESFERTRRYNRWRTLSSSSPRDSGYEQPRPAGKRLDCGYSISNFCRRLCGFGPAGEPCKPTSFPPWRPRSWGPCTS